MYSERMNVLITGAGGGLGTAVCQEFIASGAKVIGVERAWKVAAPFAMISADVSTAEGCESMVNQALEHGPLDTLVHLVGGFAGGSSVADTSDETWDKMMNINLRTAFCCVRAVLKPMQAVGRGHIVAVGTRMAVEPSPNFAAYAVSKAALVALIENVAAEGQKFGVTANVILPSTIDTAANRAAMPKVNF